MKGWRLLACCWLAIATLGAQRATPPTMREVLTAAYAVRDLSEVELSPYGDAVAWQETFHDPQRLLGSPRWSSLYVSSLSGKARVRLSAGADGRYYDEENPAWSPDGQSLAFLSDARSKDQLQVFVSDVCGQHFRQVGRLRGDVSHLSWSPDGKTLAVLYIASAHRAAGALAPGARDVGVIGSEIDEQRLTLIDPKSGAVRTVTRADRYVYEYGWSPDARRVAVTYAPGNGDNNWWIARLATVDVATGNMRDLLTPAYQINDPQWSPDGKRIAIVGGLMSDFGSTGGDLYVVDALSGEARDVTAGAAFSVQSSRWNDATSIDVVAHVPGAMHLMRVDVTSGQTTQLTDREESLWSWSTAEKGSVIALVRASFDDPPELWAGTPPALRQVTHSNANATRLYGKAVSLRWTSDGSDVQGWLIYPLDFDPARTYPMVTIVHGGPSSQTVPSFATRNVSALSSAGYFVLMPNPRGSYGRGEAFTRANVKDFGYGDWRD
ncbi:MAG: S9 family peptidase, partial [Candidatus Eremiobacteraeota bacterium]|nr:S9 family peptidase [Candidatus Eremiobacteraeota bacterium]